MYSHLKLVLFATACSHVPGHPEPAYVGPAKSPQIVVSSTRECSKK